ncbi:hypothetical protein BU15DRAFT_63246 [Melanogaster broomeanus]|nr:hypothetical protein BU15DRAFT_63246 [Melanogaster broomeanus]
MYERSRGKASAASYKRAKEIAKLGGGWARDAEGVHPILSLVRRARADNVDGHSVDEEREREEKRPAETVFELGTRGKAGTVNAALMKERRKALAKAAERTVTVGPSSVAAEDVEVDDAAQGDVTMEMADEDGDVESSAASATVADVVYKCYTPAAVESVRELKVVLGLNLLDHSPLPSKSPSHSKPVLALTGGQTGSDRVKTQVNDLDP